MELKEIPDVLFVEQDAVEQFIKKNQEYDIAQKNYGEGPFILAKEETINKII